MKWHLLACLLACLTAGVTSAVLCIAPVTGGSSHQHNYGVVNVDCAVQMKMWEWRRIDRPHNAQNGTYWLHARAEVGGCNTLYAEPPTHVDTCDGEVPD